MEKKTATNARRVEVEEKHAEADLKRAELEMKQSNATSKKNELLMSMLMELVKKGSKRVSKRVTFYVRRSTAERFRSSKLAKNLLAKGACGAYDGVSTTVLVPSRIFTTLSTLLGCSIHVYLAA